MEPHPYFETVEEAARTARTDIILAKAEEWVRTLNDIRALPETTQCPAAELL